LLFKLGKVVGRIIAGIIILGIVLVVTYLYFIVNYPLSYQGIIKEYSEIYDVDPYLIAAIINVESKYDKNAVSNKGARGLMQISPITGRWAAEELGIDNFHLDMLFEPEINIMIGVWYLDILSSEFDGNMQLILAAYNAGSGNVDNWLKDQRYSQDGKSLSRIPFEETREYVDRVIKGIKIYQLLYEDRFEQDPSKDENQLVPFINNLRKLIKGFVLCK